MARRTLYQGLWTLLLLGIFGVAACSTTTGAGGSNGASTSGYHPVHDACSLAPASALAAIVGEQVTAASLDYHGVPSCKYSDASGNFVQTSVDIEASAQAAQTFYHDGKGPEAKDVAGVGDAAAYDGIATLTVLKGNVVLGVTVLVPTVTDTLAAEKRIALLVLQHLT